MMRKSPLTYLYLIYFLFSLSSLYAQEKNVQFSGKIDSVVIRKNWRTRENIILQELEISQGSVVNTGQIEAAIARIWNIGNFATVAYRIDTLENGKILLSVTARDALTIMPNFSFSGNRKEYILTLGVNDNNLFGKNINLGIAGSIGTNARFGNLTVGIPRQLLYRNMTIRTGFSYGTAQNYRYSDGIIKSGIGYRYTNASVFIGNPYHTDYKYTFSPNLTLGFFNHTTDSTLLDVGVRNGGSYNADYITISVSESIGLINQVRHQRYGYLVSAGLGWGLGLNRDSPGYLTLGASAEYSKLFNRWLQFDAGLSTAYTTSDLPSLLCYLGPGQVRGILTGERSGKAILTARTAFLVTYINRDWIAVEQSFFMNAGSSTDAYPHLFKGDPACSVGTKVRLMVQMIPWLAINFYYAYVLDGRHWYSLDF